MSKFRPWVFPRFFWVWFDILVDILGESPIGIPLLSHLKFSCLWAEPTRGDESTPWRTYSFAQADYQTILLGIYRQPFNCKASPLFSGASLLCFPRCVHPCIPCTPVHPCCICFSCTFSCQALVFWVRVLEGLNSQFIIFSIFVLLCSLSCSYWS